MIRATILLHTDNPVTVDETLARVEDTLRHDALARLFLVSRVVTAYDGLVYVETDTEASLARLAGALQAVDGVARTLTLVHVPEETHDA